MGQFFSKSRLFVAPSILAATLPLQSRRPKVNKRIFWHHSSPHISKSQSSKSQCEFQNQKMHEASENLLPPVHSLTSSDHQQIELHHFQNLIHFDHSNHPRDLIPIALAFFPILLTSLPRSGKLGAPGDSFAAALVLLERWEGWEKLSSV